MFKTELLSPAGNMETLIMAVNNGADAVYVGGPFFGARAFADNFSLEELDKATDYCHLYGVKIYVTANTLVFEDEIDDFLDYMKFLYEINVDAVIMQDLGMISLVRKLIPNLEIHASTQMNIQNDNDLMLLNDLGVKRAVLAREMSIDEIKGLKCPIEKEIFIHGALCVCYSGQCLFSSLNGGRSGNRGRCVGSCRLPYELIGGNTSDKYLLSTKDLCLAYNIKEVLDLKVASLKIEGRMKSPQYVGYVTRVYRRLIDNYYSGLDVTISKEEIENLKLLYNREFTSGYLFNDDIYNTKSPNHLGVNLGKVIRVNDKKIYIKLDHDLYQEDGIRFCQSGKGMIINKLYNEKGLLINKGGAGDTILIDNKVNIKGKESVNKTSSKKFSEIVHTSKKIPISFSLKGLAFNNLVLKVSDGVNSITVKSVVLDRAKGSKTSYEDIFSKLNKLGNTPFYLDKCDIEIDDAFIPMSLLNNLRRKVCDELISKRCFKNNKISFEYKKKIISEENNSNSVLVRNENQLRKFKNYRIYTEDFKLYQKYKDYDIYYKLPRIMHDFPSFKGERLLISTLGGIYKYSSCNEVIADYPLNITNSETVNFLHSLGVKISTISPEVKDFALEKYAYPTEKIVYGKVDLMILKKFREDGKFLKNNIGNYYPIIHGDYTTILHHENIKLNYDGRYILFDERY